MSDDGSILNIGLRGVTIATTRICDVDGKAGKLIYRGFLVKDMAGSVCFEEIVHLLLYEKLPNIQELESFKHALIKERAIPEGILKALANVPPSALPMDALQAGVSLLAAHDPDIRTQDKGSTLKMALRLIAKLPTLIAAWERIRNGKKPIAPTAELGHAANFLYMLSGNKPDEELTAFFDTALVLHAEHSFNASTFAAREVASTRAHIYAAVSAAVGSLSGELHGGANTRVMQMLLKIGSEEKVDAYVESLLATGGKIMGLGHAVYEVDDPRAHIIAPMSKRMGEKMGDTKWYDISIKLEKAGKRAFKQKKGSDIFVNVDFYSASLYYYMGIPVDLFTPVFAIARVAGWTAHVLEEQYAGAAPKPMLYRPESEYIGDYCGPEECAFIPMEDR